MHHVTNVEHDIQKLFIIIFIILWSQVYDFRFVTSTEKKNYKMVTLFSWWEYIY